MTTKSLSQVQMMVLDLQIVARELSLVLIRLEIKLISEAAAMYFTLWQSSCLCAAT